jgi:hypothetical protein
MSGISSFEDLEREIEKVKGDFYTETGGKNTLFKKQQKYDCAKQVVSKIPLEVLLSRTCHIMPGTNCVHIDYTILKTYASPDIFDTISEHIINNFQHIKNTYGQLEVALNLDGFTVSAAERYKKLIEVFCQKCFQKNTGFAPVVIQFLVYNSPNIIDSIKHIVLPFMEENVKAKLVVASKKDSEMHNRRFYSTAI